MIAAKILDIPLRPLEGSNDIQLAKVRALIQALGFTLNAGMCDPA